MRKKCMSVSELHRDEVASLGALSNLVCGGLHIRLSLQLEAVVKQH